MALESEPACTRWSPGWAPPPHNFLMVLFKEAGPMLVECGTQSDAAPRWGGGKDKMWGLLCNYFIFCFRVSSSLMMSGCGVGEWCFGFDFLLANRCAFVNIPPQYSLKLCFCPNKFYGFLSILFFSLF